MNQGRVLAIATHPDDVESSIGGTVALAAQAGYDVLVVSPPISAELPEEREGDGGLHPRVTEAREGAAVLGAGFELVPVYPFMDEIAAYRLLVDLIRRTQPHVVLVNYSDDVHPFHAQVAHQVMTACYMAQLPTIRRTASPWSVAQVYEYRAFSARSFMPDVLIDVTATFALARKALRCHKEGLRVLPGLLRWSEALHVEYGIRLGRPYGEALLRVKGGPWDYMANRTLGEQFLLRVAELAQRLGQAETHA